MADNIAAALFNSAKIIRKSRNSRSISRLSKDSIMLYPALLSAGIPVDVDAVIVKELEKQDAAMLLSIFSLDNGINMNYYDSIADYLKTFHNNNDIPQVISTMDNLITTNSKLVAGAKESVEALSDAWDYTIESITAFIVDKQELTGKVMVAPNIATECWDITEDKLNTTSINELYQPFKATSKALEGILDNINDAMNAKNNKTNRGIDDRTTRVTNDTNTVTKTDDKGNTTTTTTVKTTRTQDTGGIVRNIDKSAPKVINDKKLSNLEPTLVQCEFLLHGGKGYSAGTDKMIHTAIFGVKVMPRLISSDIMIAELTKGLIDSNPIFKFIKWAKGENKLVRDLILGLDQVKADAGTRKLGSKVFASLRSAKRMNKIGKVTGKNVPATTTIIITDYEAEAIKQASGLNLYDEAVGQKIIADQFLLGFGIYNVETGVLSIMFDSYTTYMETTVSAMQASGGKDVNLSNIKDVLKLIGRVS